MEEPIAIRGFSRSGGTLLATVLDAHPQVAMSYEIYPHLLVPNDCQEKQDLDAFLRLMGKCRHDRQMVTRIKDRDLRTFVSRAARNGTRREDLIRLVTEHRDAAQSFHDNAGRLAFVARCCKDKMHKQGKQRWGVKISNRFEDYLAAWPSAYLLNVVRDGRDVLASQARTGAFNKTPDRVASGWARTHTKFRELMQRQDVRAREVFYERLVTEPHKELGAVCEFLDLEFTSEMLQFHAKELTVYDASHLSMDRITKPIDVTKVGRWKKELSQKDLGAFMAVAGETMAVLGYC